MFDELIGIFRCIRCRADSEARIQTYLFEREAAVYRVGVSENFDELDSVYPLIDRDPFIDGLDNFYPLHPWYPPRSSQTWLAIVVGDWECRKCGLNWQWAKLSLWADPADGGLIGHIQSLETFVPKAPSAFDDVHFVQADLAELSGLWGKPPIDYQKLDAVWSAHSVEQRVALMVAGYRTWCSEVAHVDIDSI